MGEKLGGVLVGEMEFVKFIKDEAVINALNYLARFSCLSLWTV